MVAKAWASGTKPHRRKNKWNKSQRRVPGQTEHLVISWVHNMRWRWTWMDAADIQWSVTSIEKKKLKWSENKTWLSFSGLPGQWGKESVLCPPPPVFWKKTSLDVKSTARETTFPRVIRQASSSKIWRRLPCLRDAHAWWHSGSHWVPRFGWRSAEVPLSGWRLRIGHLA